MIKRALVKNLENNVDFKKAIVILGSRQVGKTTLITKIASSINEEYLYINGDSIINNFSPIVQRDDIGALWENFVISERKKNLDYTGFYGNTYFWRTEYAPISTSVINSTNYWEFL